MIIRGIPKHPEHYICVDDEVAYLLYLEGYEALYVDNLTGIYFKKTKELLKFMEKEKMNYDTID